MRHKILRAVRENRGLPPPIAQTASRRSFDRRGGPRRVGFVAAITFLWATASPSSALANWNFDLLLTVGQNAEALDTGSVINPRFGLSIPTSKKPRLHVCMEWGLLSASLPQISEDNVTTSNGRETRFLNPSVDVMYQLKAHEKTFDFTLGISLGMSLPVADADTPGQKAAYQVALSAAGAWDPWLYIPDTLGFMLPVQAELAFKGFSLWVDTGVFLLIPTEDSRDRSTQFGPQFGIEGIVPAGRFDLGLRFQLVQVGDNGDNEGRVHTSIVPLARLHLEPAIIHSRFNLNLGTAGGTPFGSAGTWGWSLGISFVF